MEFVWVVLEEDRVAGVFASLKAAEAFLESPEGSNCFLDSEVGEYVQGGE